jgi:hypothetical protein
MSKKVEIEGVGVVEFPDTMSDQEIGTTIIEKIIPERDRQRAGGQTLTAAGPERPFFEKDGSRYLPTGEYIPPPAEQSLGLLDPAAAIGTGPTTEAPPILPMPQVVEENLPLAGALGGSLATGGLGLPAVLAAGGGAMLGGVPKVKGREIRTGEDIPWQQEAMEIGMEGLAGAGGEAIGILGSKLMHPILAPYAKKLADNGDAVAAQKLVTEGFAISPDQINKGRLAAGIQKVVDTVPPGTWVTKRHRTKLGQMLTNARQDFITDTLGLPGAGTGAELKAQRDALFQEALDIAEDVTFSTKSIGEWVNEYGADTITSKKLRDTVVKTLKDPSIENMNSIKSLVWRGFKDLSPDERTARGALKSALENDVSAGMPKVLKLWDEATQKGTDMRMVSKSNYLESLFAKSTVYDQASEEMVFSPLLFDKNLKGARNRLNRMFKDDPGALEAIDAFHDKTQRLLVDTQRLRQARPNAAKDLGVIGIPAAAVGLKGPIGGAAIAVPLGFEGIMAHSLMKPNGLLRQWLTFGVEAPILRQGARRAMQQGLGNIVQDPQRSLREAQEILEPIR